MGALHLNLIVFIISSLIPNSIYSKQAFRSIIFQVEDTVASLYIDSTSMIPHAVCTSTDTAILYPNEVECLIYADPEIQLNQFPDGISKLKKLRELSIQNQKNLDWYDTFEKLSHLDSLKVLEIIDCTVKSFPENLSKLKHLKRLLVQMNKDSSCIKFPISITNCINLEELFFENTNEVPEQIKNLKQLKKIGIGFGLNKFPDQFLLLKNIEEVYLDYNDIHELSNDIVQLKNLRILSIKDTPLACFEFNYYCKYHKYKKLQYLKENMPKLDIQLFYSGPEI